MGDIGKDLNYLIATGNLRSKSGLGLQQMAGLVVTAEKINFARFYCHFRTIHRGAFFMEMKTTTPRKLATAAWGFICPVNTPDGPPCGLMNHLAHTGITRISIFFWPHFEWIFFVQRFSRESLDFWNCNILTFEILVVVVILNY